MNYNVQNNPNNVTSYYESTIILNCYLFIRLEQLFVELKGKNSANFARRGIAHSVFVSLINIIVTFTKPIGVAFMT